MRNGEFYAAVVAAPIDRRRRRLFRVERLTCPDDKRVGGGWGSAMICIATDEV
jgi:hypothetical protein